MKSKKLTKQAISWAPYPNTLKETSPKKNSSVSVSHSTRETNSDVSMSVDPPTTLTRNPSNSRALQIPPPSQPSPPQPYAVSQPVGVNMPADRQLAKTNVSMPQGQELTNNIRPILESSAILYNNNQPADSELWDGLFSPISLLEIKKFLSSNAQNITCSLL